MIGKGSQVFRSVGARYLEAFVDMKDFLIENIIEAYLITQYSPYTDCFWIFLLTYLPIQVLGHSETGWDLSRFAAVLQYLRLDKCLLEQQNTKKL